MNQSRYMGLGVVILGLFFLFILIPVGVVEPGRVDQIALAPRFWPQIIAVIIALMGVIMIIKPSEEDNEHAANENQISKAARALGFCIAFGSLFAFYLLIPLIGMVVPGMVLIFTLMLFAGERRYMLALSIAVVTPLVLYFFFVHVANIPIPLGVFESLRG